jgi:hypothetical protein
MKAACSTSSAVLSRELVDDTLQLHPETEACPQTGQTFPSHAAAGIGRYGVGERREMYSFLLVLQDEAHLDWEQSDATMGTHPHLWTGPVSTVTLHVPQIPSCVVGMLQGAEARYIAVWKKEVGKPREEVHHNPMVVASKRDLDIGGEAAARNQAADHRGIQVEEAHAPSGRVPGFLEVGRAVGSGRVPALLHDEVAAFHSRIVVRQVAETTVVVRILEEVVSTVPF